MEEIRTHEQCVSWLSNHGMPTSGSLACLQARINKCLLYPKLTEKLRKKHEKKFKFPTSLSPDDVPPLSSVWSADESCYPKVYKSTLQQYLGNKRAGLDSQQLKAHKMLTSRKITTIKTCTQGDNIFVRGWVIRSYGDKQKVESTRPAVILF